VGAAPPPSPQFSRIFSPTRTMAPVKSNPGPVKVP
jgi:hypothetical protein